MSRPSNAEKLMRSPFRARNRPAGPLGPDSERPPEAATERESELGQATYNCGCGYVFRAAVLTSVDCPHCGDAQAW